jgi:vesicular inhibitory amino acid transporter
MPPKRQPIPPTWGSYERGGRTASTDSDMSNSRVHFDEDSEQHLDGSTGGTHHPEGGAYEHGGTLERTLRPRRSSMSMRINSIRYAGGVNSIDNFARSWQRAAGFYEIAPVRQSFRHSDAGDDEFSRENVEGTPKDQRSLLRQAFQEHERNRTGGADAGAIEEDDGDYSNGRPEASESLGGSSNSGTVKGERQSLLRERLSGVQDDSIFSIEPQLASPFGGSYGSTWGSLKSNVNEPSMRHAGRLFRQQQVSGSTDPDKEREPLLVKQVEEDDGRIVNVVVGQSTLPQTIFNSVNVLIGVGLLALPLAMRYSGWIPGLIFFFFAASSTSYTAKILAKCLDVDSSLITFADLAYVSFGPKARVATSILFSLELLATCVALVVLFADSLNALTDSSFGLTSWKIVCGIILVPLSFLPLRFLSFTSILGIMSCFLIVAAVFIDGLIKPDSPGSLLSPAPQHLFPTNWGTLPLSFGLLMSPWGGHSVFPNIYRDMRHPYKYRRGVNITYAFTFTLDLFMACVGLLMYGDGVKDEITRNILLTEGAPEWLSLLIVICVAIIPLTKVPLNARPIVSTLELFLGLDARTLAPEAATTGLSSLSRGILKFSVRIACVIAFVVLAILVPDFDRIMSLMGAVACFTICIMLPAAFHLKLFGDQLSKWEKSRDWALIVVSGILGLVSTAFNFVPKEKLGL